MVIGKGKEGWDNLQFLMQGGVRRQPNQIPQHKCCTRIMTTAVKRSEPILRVTFPTSFPFCISCITSIPLFFRLCPHGVSKVTIRRGVLQIEFFGRVIGEHPRKDRILGQRQQGPSSCRVEMHQISICGDFSSLPCLGECQKRGSGQGARVDGHSSETHVFSMYWLLNELMWTKGKGSQR